MQESVFLVINLLSLPFQSPAKAGNQEEGLHCRTGEELESISVLGKVTALGAGGPSRRLEWVNWCSAWQNKEQYYSL